MSGKEQGSNPLIGPKFETNEKAHTLYHEQNIYHSHPEVFRRRPDLQLTMNIHIDNFFDATGRSNTEKEVVKQVTTEYMMTRYNRGVELQSPEAKHARTLAAQYFNEVVNDEVFVGNNLCMDMRTRKTLMFGFPGRFGGSLRFPGGKPSGFQRVGFGEQLRLDPQSSYATEMARTLRKSRNSLQLVDSHHGCKYRLDIEEDKTGVEPEHAGVESDRRYKGHMIRAIGEFAKSYDIQSLTFVQTSFNPETGFADFLDEESYQDVVISTDTLAYQHLEDIFKERSFTVDWLQNYAKSLEHFWINVQSMKEDALPIIREQMQKVYPNLEAKDPVKFAMKTRIALLSAYSGWLNNLHQPEYPHSKHKENLVVALAGGEHGPFELESFEIPFESPDLRDEAAYSTRLVRNFRTIGEKTDPVPFIIQARTNASSRAEVQQVSEVALKIVEDLATRRQDWMDMDYRALTRYISDVSGDDEVSLSLGVSFAEVIEKMKLIYSRDTDDRFGVSLHAGSIVPMPVFVDQDRSPIIALPLLPSR
jgi:hypothetical protein